MKTLKVIIDGREFEAEEGVSVLQVARSNGIRIPTLCYHEALKPIGACKLCGVEVRGRTGKTRILLACILRAREGLEVKTQSELAMRARTSAFRNLLAMAPQSKFIRDLAEAYNVDVGPTADGCVRCRLCIRVCKEIVGVGALKMEKRKGVSSVRNETIGVHALERCEACGRYFASQKFIKHVQVRTSEHTEVKEHHLYCPTCVKLFSTRVKSSSRIKRVG